MEYELGPVSAIPPGEGREFVVEGQPIAVFRTRGGGVYATQARCPHRGGPLADGILGGTTVICPFHAWEFDVSTGTAVLGECGVRIFETRMESGRIHVQLPEGVAGFSLSEVVACSESSS